MSVVMSNEIQNISAGDSVKNEQTYSVIRKSVITAQSKIYTAVNSALAQVYWEIEECAKSGWSVRQSERRTGVTDSVQYTKQGGTSRTALFLLSRVCPCQAWGLSLLVCRPAILRLRYL